MKLALSVRTQAIMVLALVATLGALVGILADRIAAQQSTAVELAPPPAFRGISGGAAPGGGPLGGPGARGPGQMRYIEGLGEQLSLTAEQRAAIDSIMAEQRTQVHALQQEMQPRFRQIAEQTRTRVERVLTDSQRQEMRRLRQERNRQERFRPRDARFDRRPNL